MKKIILIIFVLMFCFADKAIVFQIEDFDEGLDIGKLHKEIAASITSFTSISKGEDNIQIHTSIALMPTETNTLNDIVSNHTPTLTPFSLPQHFIEEQKKRQLIINSTKCNLIGYLLMSQTASNFDHAKIIAKPFMRQYLLEIYGYSQLDYIPLIDVISNNSINLWLTNIVPQAGSQTIRDLLLSELDVE